MLGSSSFHPPLYNNGEGEGEGEELGQPNQVQIRTAEFWEDM